MFTARYGLKCISEVARVQSQVIPCEICGGQSGTRTVFFSPNTLIFPRQYHYASAPFLSSFSCCSSQDKRAQPGNLRKSSAASEIGEHRIENCFTWSIKG